MATRRRAGTWWLTPVGLVALVSLPTTWLALAIPDERYRVLWRTPKYVTPEGTGWATIGLLLFVIGALVPSVMRPAGPVADWPALSRRDLRLLETASTVLFRLTILGYLAFGAAALSAGITPQFLLDALVSQDLYSGGEIEARLGTIAGVTTMTQFAASYVIVTTLLLLSGQPRHHHVRRLAVVAVLTLVRAFFLTERLAILELAVPVLAIAVTRMSRTPRGARRAALMPAVLLPVVVGVFAAFEYSRSWVFYQAQGGRSFPTFIVERFAGYYVTAYNNGQIRLDHDPPVSVPYDLLSALWTAPGIGDARVFERLAGYAQPDTYFAALERYGNPEFNNIGGVATPFVDLGLTGGLVYYVVAGLGCGLLYRAYQEGRPLGLLVYPIAALTLLELPRYVYWSQGRATPALLALAVTAVVVQRARRRDAATPADVMAPATSTR
jgi:hypothetical protein